MKMKATKIHPIFHACVDEGGGIFSTDKIAVRDGWRFASDGRVIVRQRTDEPNTDWKSPDQEQAPWGREKYADIAIAIPDLGEQPMIACCECKGKWRGKTCSRCGGRGHRGRACCQFCAGHGKWADCRFCDAGKTAAPAVSIDLGPVALSDLYIRLIFPWVKEVFPSKKNSTTCPVYFMVGEIEGLLMPRTKEEPE